MIRCPSCNSRRWDGKQCERCHYQSESGPYHTTSFSKQYRYGSDNGLAIPMVDYHKAAFKFAILGTEGKPWQVQKQMKNWTQEWHYGEGYRALKTSKSVIIYIDKRIKAEWTKVEEV